MVCIRWIAAETDDPLWMDECDAAGNRTAWKIGVQAIANTMGVSVMAAYTIVNRIDDFACLPEQNIAHSMTSFMAQNSGAGKKERVRKGFWGGMKIELVYGMIIFWCASFCRADCAFVRQ